MEDIVFKSDDLVVMSLINYFITEKNYNPMIIHGLNDEIWLENLNEDYKIVRIVSHHIHNKEQLDFDKFKLSRIVKQVKKKTLSFKVKVLSIYTDLEDDKILSNDDIYNMIVNDVNNDDSINNILKNKVIDKSNVYRSDISDYIYDLNIFVIIVLLFVLEKNKINILRRLGDTFIISGSFIIVIGLIFKFIIKSNIYFINISNVINVIFNQFLVISMVFYICGIISYLGYYLIIKSV